MEDENSGGRNWKHDENESVRKSSYLCYLGRKANYAPGVSNTTHRAFNTLGIEFLLHPRCHDNQNR
jgi:hypothetical protein